MAGSEPREGLPEGPLCMCLALPHIGDLEGIVLSLPLLLITTCLLMPSISESHKTLVLPQPVHQGYMADVGKTVCLSVYPYPPVCAEYQAEAMPLFSPHLRRVRGTTFY